MEALARFQERVARAVSHDLRTPLSAIVNFASVLGSQHDFSADEIRDLGRRIRANAERTLRMVHVLETAMRLAGRSSRTAATDLVALATSVLADAGGHKPVQAGTGGTKGLVDVDAEVLGFVWRAYVAVENDARGVPVENAELRVDPQPEWIAVELSCPGDAGADPRRGHAPPALELTAFLRHDGGPARLECAFGMNLARELVLRHGGKLELHGRPAAGSAMRATWPRNRSHGAEGRTEVR